MLASYPFIYVSIFIVHVHAVAIWQSVIVKIQVCPFNFYPHKESLYFPWTLGSKKGNSFCFTAKTMCKKNWEVLLCLSGQSSDPSAFQIHLQAFQSWTKFSPEQSNISVLLHNLFPTHPQPDFYIKYFIEIKSRLRVSILSQIQRVLFIPWLSFSWRWMISLPKLACSLCQMILRWWAHFAGSKGKLICPQNKKNL